MIVRRLRNYFKNFNELCTETMVIFLKIYLVVDGKKVLVTGVKANMKNKFMILKEKILLKKRSLIESVFSVLKRNGLEYSFHRSVHRFILHIPGSLISYQLCHKS